MKRVPVVVGCPVELALVLLGGKWKTVMLARLKEGPLRYGELRRQIPELSDKILTERLADLKASGLVAQVGAKRGGAYRLTNRGESVRPLLQALYDWGSGQASEMNIAVRGIR
jgi:DNA-binding HxlR family transcriptional regulator